MRLTSVIPNQKVEGSVTIFSEGAFEKVHSPYLSVEALSADRHQHQTVKMKERLNYFTDRENPSSKFQSLVRRAWESRDSPHLYVREAMYPMDGSGTFGARDSNCQCAQGPFPSGSHPLIEHPCPPAQLQ